MAMRRRVRMAELGRIFWLLDKSAWERDYWAPDNDLRTAVELFPSH